jgi:hypothetical protein
VQAAAVKGLGSGSYCRVIQRFFSWYARNLDRKGENTLHRRQLHHGDPPEYP